MIDTFSIDSIAACKMNKTLGYQKNISQQPPCLLYVNYPGVSSIYHTLFGLMC